MTTSGDVGSDIPDLYADIFIDDLNYTVAAVVPEPASIVLLGSAMLAMLATVAATRRRAA